MLKWGKVESAYIIKDPHLRRKWRPGRVMVALILAGFTAVAWWAGKSF